MGDIKLFKVGNNGVEEIAGQSVALEKSLQTLIEKNLEALFGVRFLASEYSTGPKHGGRIDSLGIDENRCPVIIEYKRALNENVINQGLYYLDWLMDHRAEFELLVLKHLGKKVSDEIEWSTPRLMCIAGEFTKFDEHAVKQMKRNIELVRYRKYGAQLLLFELVNTVTAESPAGTKPTKNGKAAKGVYKTFSQYLQQSKPDLRDRFESLKAFCMALGDDVQMNTLKYYAAFKRLKNFCCVEIHPQNGTILVFLKVNPAEIALEKGFSRDVSKIGHYGTGDLELTLSKPYDLERAKSLIVKSYEAS